MENGPRDTNLDYARVTWLARLFAPLRTRGATFETNGKVVFDLSMNIYGEGIATFRMDMCSAVRYNPSRVEFTNGYKVSN